MKKFFKIVGWIAGIYAGLTTLIYAWIGYSRYLHYAFDGLDSDTNVNDKINRSTDIMLDEAIGSWSKCINYFKK